MTHTSDHNDLNTTYYKLVVTYASYLWNKLFNYEKIKTRLISSLSEKKLEALMLFERDIEIPHDVIINRLTATSTEIKRLLEG